MISSTSRTEASARTHDPRLSRVTDCDLGQGAGDAPQGGRNLRPPCVASFSNPVTLLEIA